MSHAAPRPDFLRPVSRPGWLAWTWCVTGLLVLAVTAADGQAAWLARQQAQDRLAASRTPTPPAAMPARTATPAGRSPAQARAAEAQRWRDQLAWPWATVWAASETGTDGVQWLAFDHGPDGLRLSGLAATPDGADTAAAALRGQQVQGRPAWQAVTLAAMERVPGGQRFDLVARLAPAPGDGPTPPPLGTGAAR